MIYSDSEARRLRINEEQRARRTKNPDHVRAIERRSYENNKETRRRYNKEHYGTAKVLAREAVRVAFKSGRLPHATTLLCFACGEPATEYHHEDYAKEKWLDVQPFCRQCHKDIHFSSTSR